VAFHHDKGGTMTEPIKEIREQAGLSEPAAGQTTNVYAHDGKMLVVAYDEGKPDEMKLAVIDDSSDTESEAGA
jgi:hypothetical protein